MIGRWKDDAVFVSLQASEGDLVFRYPKLGSDAIPNCKMGATCIIIVCFRYYWRHRSLRAAPFFAEEKQGDARLYETYKAGDESGSKRLC